MTHPGIGEAHSPAGGGGAAGEAVVAGRPTLRRIGSGWLFIRDDGEGYLIDRMWLEGAKIAFAGAIVKGFIAYRLVRLFGLGWRTDGWRWRLLPSAGDWAFRDNDGRLANLAHFINAELYRRGC